MNAIDVVKKINGSDLSCNGLEERKILDLALSMAIVNNGKYMCPFNNAYFSLTDKQINYIDSLIKSFFTKYNKVPKFGCKVNGEWYDVNLKVYSKYLQGSNKYENKKYLILHINI